MSDAKTEFALMQKVLESHQLTGMIYPPFDY